MALSFAFGGNTGLSYEDLQRRRMFAEGLMQRGMGSQPKTAMEGLNSAASSIMGALLAKRLSGEEAKGREAASSVFRDIISGRAGGMGSYGGMPATPADPNPNAPQNIADDTMRALGKMPDYAGLERQYGLPEGYLTQTRQIESGGNPNAQNPNSSAGGDFQFIDSTARQYGLTNKNDPFASADAAARLGADNMSVLTNALGRKPTAGELYLAHQQGGGGAAKLLANPNARAVDIVGAEAVRLNGGSPDMTAGQFAQKWVGKFGGGQSASPVNPMDLPALASFIANPYADPGQKAVAQTLMGQMMQSFDPSYQMDLERQRLELDAMRNPQADMPEMVRQREALAARAGLQPGTPEYREFMLTGNTVGRGANEYGLNPIFGTDKNGNITVMQLGKDGTAISTKLPEGITPNLGIRKEEEARGTATGKASGEALATIPGAQETANLVRGQIQSLINDPYLPKMIGPIDSRLPNVSGDAARVQSKIDQLQGGAFLQAYNILRGGGQITEVEGNKAQAAMARMNTAQNLNDFKQALLDFQDAVDSGLAKLSATGGASAYGSTTASGAPSKTTYTYNPATGELE